jgi:DNA-binding response OmpR family regulator
VAQAADTPATCAMTVAGQSCQRPPDRTMIVRGEPMPICAECAETASVFLINQGVRQAEIETILRDEKPAPSRRGRGDSAKESGGPVKILIVEDDHVIRGALQRSMTDLGYHVDAVGTALEALRDVVAEQPDLIVLDLGLPDLDGSDALRMLRGISDVPVVVATARDDEQGIVRLLRGGADDYMIKPFTSAHLAARISAVLRRTGTPAWATEIYQDTLLRLDSKARTVHVNGAEVALTPTEFRMLNMFVRNATRVLSVNHLLSEVWEDPTGIGPDRVKFTVLRLRRKLGWTDPATSPIVSVRGVGYRYRPPQPPPPAADYASTAHGPRIVEMLNQQRT